MSAPFQLPARLDLAAAGPLVAALRERAGQPMVLDAGAVTHFGALGLQALLALRLTQQRAGSSLGVCPRSPAFDLALASYGLAPADLEWEGTPCR